MRTAALALVVAALLRGCGGTTAERESARASRQSAGPLQRAWVTYRDGVAFRDADRAFYALYAVGPRASEETRAALVRVLSSLRFDPRQ